MGIVPLLPTTRLHLTFGPAPRTMDNMPIDEKSLGPTQENHQELEIGTFDPENQFSVYAMTPPSWRPHLEAAVFEAPEIFEIGDDTQFKKFAKEKWGVAYNATEHRLRYNFWLEYDEALSEGRKMKGPRVYGTIHDSRVFERYYLPKRPLVAWMLRKPLGYSTAMNELLTYGLEQMRRILDMSEIDPKTGQIDKKILELKLKITQMADMRKHGAPTQKSVQLTGSIDKDVSKALIINDAKSIKTRFYELNQKKKALLGLNTSEKEPEVEEAIEVGNPTKQS